MCVLNHERTIIKQDAKAKLETYECRFSYCCCRHSPSGSQWDHRMLGHWSYTSCSQLHKLQSHECIDSFIAYWTTNLCNFKIQSSKSLIYLKRLFLNSLLTLASLARGDVDVASIARRRIAHLVAVLITDVTVCITHGASLWRGDEAVADSAQTRVTERSTINVTRTAVTVARYIVHSISIKLNLRESL
jgi:hypothetical protein